MPDLQERTFASLRAALPDTAGACVAAIVREVPGYDRAFDARLRHNIERTVEQALSTFVEMQASGAARPAHTATLDGARTLGEGEAASGRSTDALLSAYRVGARVAWQCFSTRAVECGEPADVVATLAARTFTFIDELSAASLAGHTEALTRRTRELARRRDQLAAALVAGENPTALTRLADDARWRPPTTLTALVVDDEESPTWHTALGEDALWAPASGGPSVALLPDLGTSRRASALQAVRGTRAALGLTTPWTDVAESVRRAHRLLPSAGTPATIDAEDALPELLLDADPLAAQRLRERALLPLAGLTPVKRDVLAQTLLCWLMHQGHRDDVAAALHVHPQTVRYRMNQIRELYGERLSNPREMFELMLGLVAAHTDDEGDR